MKEKKERMFDSISWAALRIHIFQIRKFYATKWDFNFKASLLFLHKKTKFPKKF